MDPHQPYRPPNDFHVFTGPTGEFDYPPQLIRSLNKYDGEILYLDSEIGSLLHYLRKEDLYDNTVIVLTADHGEHFYEFTDKNGHGHTLYSVETHVPLIIKAKGSPRKVEETVSLTDIYPTLFDIVGIDLEHEVQGSPLLSLENQDRVPGALTEFTRYSCDKAYVSANRDKLMISYDAEPDALITQEDETATSLYELKTSHLEREAVTNSGLEKQLRANLYLLYAKSLEYRKKINVETVKLRNDSLDELKALGYIN